jgi:hypothetical protein
MPFRLVLNAFSPVIKFVFLAVLDVYRVGGFGTVCLSTHYFFGMR